MNNQMKSCDIKTPKFLMVALTTTTATQVGPLLTKGISEDAGLTTSTQVTRVKIYGFKAVSATGVPTNNAQTLYWGWLDSLNAFGNGATKPGFVESIAAGGSATIGDTKPGVKYDLNNLYVTGTTTDFAVIEYEQ